MTYLKQVINTNILMILHISLKICKEIQNNELPLSYTLDTHLHAAIF